MPKEKSSKSVLLRQWIDNDVNFTTDGKVIFCQPCGKKVKCEKRCHLVQHKGTFIHQKNSQKKVGQQTFLSFSDGNDGECEKFSNDLCFAMVSANIAWKKLENPVFNNVLTKYTGKNIPDESTLRKNYLHPCYLRTIDEIRGDMSNSYFWISVDETTDRCGRYIANVIVGKLSSEPGKPHLIACKVLEKTNHCTIVRVVRDAMRILWPTEDSDQNLHFLVTDGALYMLKATETFQTLYPKMIDLTCLVHAIHRVAEDIRSRFPRVNAVISLMKKVFLKAPSHIVVFRETLPNLSLPPQPILTRWGTWLEAAVYYADNLKDIQKVLEKLDDDDSVAIVEAKAAAAKGHVHEDLAFIKCHFGNIPKNIKALEARNLPLMESVAIFNEVKGSIEQAPGAIGREVSQKLQRILQRNPGVKQIFKIADILAGKSEDSSLEEETLTPAEIAAFKYCPIASCEVERSFSHYKNILSDTRTKFTPENLEKYIVVNCNYNL